MKKDKFEECKKELEAALKKAKTNGKKGITRDSLSEYTISCLELILGICPKFIKEEQISKVLYTLSSQSKNLRDQEYKNKNALLVDQSSDEPSQENGSHAREDKEPFIGESTKYYELCKLVATKYQLRRPYLGYGLIGIYFLQKSNPEGYFSKEDIEAFLQDNKLNKTKIDHINWEILGNGKRAKENQVRLLEIKEKQSNDKRFRLKREVFMFIDSIITKKQDDENEEKLRNQIVEFVYTFKNKDGTSYEEIAHQILSQNIDNPVFEISWKDGRV